ncbi:RGG repeats nuclear RNA binding protein A-like isoform X4 [Arachis ipaensis]|uniref:RGG repeats nuclear RNA binding protein A-like isoform X4 n=1 Tax=Arachis ipaensis TaxID=130454 RepID=UPI000A2B42BA|nr:RGG repeats nuclear RNA binding protein A-like isoform X4 [Arachis ipaensis]XP_020968165.1 RGG repeats nuclear RNA binding protein A-like isoform X4 [Arachis ipaensis]XP_020968166.1 RGG repeats nuclear RNA binding protein A-like isoform X4 [Arachis ipaensis]
MATSNPFHLRGDDAEVSSRQIAAAAATSPLKKGSAAAAQQQQQTQLASKPVPPAQAVLSGGEDLRLDIRDGKEKARGYSEEGATTG